MAQTGENSHCYSHSDKADFKSKEPEEIKKVYILIKRTIHQKDITVLSTYAPNVGASNFIR